MDRHEPRCERHSSPTGQADLSPPDVEQAAKLIQKASADDPELGRLLHLAASTGAHRGELCALRWSKVDTDLATLTIERSIIEVPGGLAEKDTRPTPADESPLTPARSPSSKLSEPMPYEEPSFASSS